MYKLKRISGKETIRRLEKLGFKRVRQRGSHVVLKKQTIDDESSWNFAWYFEASKTDG